MQPNPTTTTTPQAIIGTIGDMDAYQLPDAKGYTAFLRHVLGVKDEERQVRNERGTCVVFCVGKGGWRWTLCICIACFVHVQYLCFAAPLTPSSTTQIRREQILSTTTKDFHEFADVLESIRTKGKVVAVTSAERAQAANEERDGFFSTVRKML